ncbi:MAG: hypothetical protein SO170_06435 [Butyribacter sp.]|nr:hypothetical protein [bacterium]MDY3854571.1 hypothetical protein [Butyribacter sp.]
MNTLQFEWKRAIKSSGMKISLLLGFILAAGHFVGFQTLYRFNEEFNKDFMLSNGDYAIGIYPNVVYESFIGGEGYTVFNQIYYYLFPIFAALPFATSFFGDENSGYVKNILVKTKKKTYMISKFFSTFASGAIASVFPLVCSFFLASLCFPFLNPNQMTYQSAVQDITMLSEFYYTKTWLYLLCYLGIDMLFGGMLATLALSISYFAKNYLVVLFSPFLIYLLQNFIFSEFRWNKWTVMHIINPMATGAHENMTVSFVLLYCLLGTLVSFLLFYIIGKRREKVV